MASYRDVLRVAEFRRLYIAQAMSQIGDQLAAVAVAVLVFDQTGSGLLTAVAYASAWIPGIVGGPLLGPFADRIPRRTVMVVCDVARAVVFATLAVPGMPLPLLVVLLYLGNLLNSPFTAARAAMLPDVLRGEAYVTANGLGNITYQFAQIVGYVVGGVAVGLIHPRGVLIADAVTFAVSALAIRLGVRDRPAASAPDARGSFLGDVRIGVGYVFRDPWLRGCLLLVWGASAFAYAPEAIIYPYARRLGGGPVEAGLLLAAPCVGYIAGAFLLARKLRPQVRDKLLVPAAMLATVALVPTLLAPPVAVVLVCFTAMGVGASFAAPLNAIFARRVDPSLRGRAMSVAISGLIAAQGLGFLLAGGLVQANLSPALATGLCGVAGTLLIVAVRFRAPALGESAPRPRHAAPEPANLDEVDADAETDAPLIPPQSSKPGAHARR
jgi:MFS family permease